MKKVGIITYYNLYNYGSVLQAYGLINVMEKLGFEAVLIDYANMKKKHNIIMKIKTYKNRLFCCLIHPTLIYSTFAKKRVGRQTIVSRSEELKGKFDDFINDRLNKSDENYLKAEKNGFEAFICGSDQVWQLTAPGLHELFFLRFAPEKMRIAYSPSFGGVTIPEYNKKRLKKYLSQIPYLSTREDTGVDVVMQSTGRIISQVLDPVLLVGADFWKKHMKSINIEIKPYLACYFLSDASHTYEAIQQICDEYDLEVKWITSGKPLIDRDFKQYDVEPLEFVSIISNAKFVFTDSLHGAEFAITLQTPFYIFKRNYEVVPEQNTRIESLLRITKLENRLVRNSAEVDIEHCTNIDFENSEKSLEIERKKSRKYLIEALNKATEVETNLV